jgi:hypothetical protein
MSLSSHKSLTSTEVPGSRSKSDQDAVTVAFAELLFHKTTASLLPLRGLALTCTFSCIYIIGSISQILLIYRTIGSSPYITVRLRSKMVTQCLKLKNLRLGNSYSSCFKDWIDIPVKLNWTIICYFKSYIDVATTFSSNLSQWPGSEKNKMAVHLASDLTGWTITVCWFHWNLFLKRRSWQCCLFSLSSIDLHDILNFRGLCFCRGRQVILVSKF